MNYKVSKKENIYFGICFLATVGIIYGIFNFVKNSDEKMLTILMPFAFYVVAIILYLFISHGILIGYLKGNAIRINERQFPDIHNILAEQSQKLGIAKVPTLYLVQSGGILNAFATRSFGRNYIVLYSDILEVAFQEGKDAVEFIIGHEFGHIKRNHLIKKMLILPALFIPFLFQAYSRACEYTCDNIGGHLSFHGGTKGMLILAAGKELYRHIDPDEYIHAFKAEKGFWKWFAQIVSTHPNIPKRILNLRAGPA